MEWGLNRSVELEHWNHTGLKINECAVLMKTSKINVL